MTENKKDDFTDWSRRQLTYLEFPDIEHITDANITKMLFEPGPKRTNLLLWILNSLLKLNLSWENPISDKTWTDMIDALYYYGYVSAEEKVKFTMGKMQKDSQKDIWERIFESLTLVKSSKQKSVLDVPSYFKDFLLTDNSIRSLLENKNKPKTEKLPETGMSTSLNIDEKNSKTDITTLKLQEMELYQTENLVEEISKFKHYYDEQLEPHFKGLTISSGAKALGEKIQEIHTHWNNWKEFAKQRSDLIKLVEEFPKPEIDCTENQPLADVIQAINSI